MKRKELLIKARKKRDMARRMLLKGKTDAEIDSAVFKKFRSRMCAATLCSLRQELGIGNKRRKPQPWPVYPETDKVAIMPRPGKNGPRATDPDLKECLGAVFHWMLGEGITRIEIDPTSLRVTLDRKNKTARIG